MLFRSAILSGLGEFFLGAREIISGSPHVVSTWRGRLSPELETMLEEGVRAFSQEFKDIINWLEANAPNATIIVNTIYNPIPQEILRVSIPISHWANAFIESMNYTIIRESESRDFLVSDIHSHFFNRPDLTNLNLNPFAGALSFDIVHPNGDGHSLIADLNYATFNQYLQGN